MEARYMEVLRREIETDPLGRGYAGMTDAQVSGSLNEANRPIARTAMTCKELMAALHVADIRAVKGDDLQIFLCMVQMADELDISDPHTWEIIEYPFLPGSPTKLALEALRVWVKSRAFEIGLPGIVTSDVMEARKNL